MELSKAKFPNLNSFCHFNFKYFNVFMCWLTFGIKLISPSLFISSLFNNSKYVKLSVRLKSKLNEPSNLELILKKKFLIFNNFKSLIQLISL